MAPWGSIDGRAATRVLAAPAALLLAQAVLFPIPAGVYVQGLTLGLLGALVAVGMCLVYRTNRIINFAQSALGLVPAVVAVDLMIYSGWSFVEAGVAGLLLSAALGVVLYAVVVRRLAQSRLILTVATIGVAQACLIASLYVPRLWGQDTRAQQITSGWTLDLLVEPLRFHAEHVLAWVVGPAVLALLAALLMRTRAGVAARAAADRPERAATLGIPVERVQGVVWATAAALSFIGVFLRVAVVGLPFAATESFTALLTVLAALTIGRFTHILRVAVSAVALGVVEQAVTWNHPEDPDLYAVVLAVVILVGLLLMAGPRTRAERDASSWQVDGRARPLPRAVARRPVVRLARALGTLAVLAVAIDLPRHLDSGDQLKAATVAVFAIVGMSLVVLTGWAGQVSLGQMGFVAVGAAVGSWLTAVEGYDLSVALIGASAAGAVVALVVGLPALRLRGLYLAVVTLAFNVATSSYLLRSGSTGWFPSGRVARASFLGIDLSTERSMYFLCLGALVATFWVSHAVRRGRPGRAMVAQRDNAEASESFGLGTTRTRLTAFGLSGAIAALAGCLLVHVLQTFPDQLLTPDRSISTFGATVVGGIASPAGAVIGAVAFVGSGWLLGDAARVLATAIGTLVVLIVFPSGVSGALATARNRVLRPWIRAATDVEGEDIDEAEVAHRAPVPATVLADSGHLRDDVPALRVRGLRVRLGDALIIDGVDLEVPAGSTLALLGTNGAGKSTILNAICGLVPVESGTIELDGTDVTNRRADRVASLGIGQAPGGRGVFPSLTVAEHLELAGWTHPRSDPGVATRTAAALEAFPQLRRRSHEPAANLSGGEQQMLVLAMASVAQPTVLLIDELSLGLAPIVVQQLVSFLDELRAGGTTIVLVEQSLTTAAALTEQAAFLERGQIRFAGPTSDLLDRPDLARSVYLAGEAAARAADGRPTIGPASGASPAPDQGTLLSAEGVSVRYGGVDALTDVDLVVGAGEAVGLIGPNGAGKSTLLDVLCGLARPVSGRVSMDGRDVTALAFSGRTRAGLGRSFQDARLFPSLTVEETLAIASDRAVHAIGVADAVLRTPAQRRDESAVRRHVADLVERLNLGAYRSRTIGELSTGQRRIVDLAALVAHQPTVALLDEPSSGLAQAEVEALGDLLSRIRAELDLAIVIVEHDIPLVSSFASRLVALDQGRVIASGDPSAVLSDPEVVAAYLGTIPGTEPLAVD